MLYFLITSSKSNDHEVLPNQTILNKYIPEVSMYKNGLWVSATGTLKIHYWILKNTNFNIDYYISESEHGITLFNGWVNDGNNLDTPLAERDMSFYNNPVSGEYVFINFNKNGEGVFRRNLSASIQTYSAEKDGNLFLSNRSSLLNAVVNKDISFEKTLDTQFMSWLISTSWAHDNSSLFKNIKILKQGAEVNFKDNKYEIIHLEKLWEDETYKSEYKNNKVKYWDDCYSVLIDNLNLFFSFFNTPFDFLLSGGKDSRLLLGLILNSNGKPLIKKTLTNGPPYSGEVVVGKMVSDHLNIPHTSNEGGYLGFNMTDKFGDHIFFTEGEVSPMDLTPNYTRVSKKMVLRGQETSLRNIAATSENDRKTISNWFNNHLASFNSLGLLNSEFVENQKVKFFENWLDNCKDYSNLPTKNRIETRYLRWGARIWGSHNTNEFTPFIFLDDNIIKYTFNAGANARIDEEFHFEMIKRCGNGLLDIPFCNQKWPDKYNLPKHTISHYQVDKKPMRGSHAILAKNIEDIKEFIKSSKLNHLMKDIVDWHKLELITEENIKSGHFQPFWHLVQLAAIANLDSFTQEEVSKIHEQMNGFPLLKDNVVAEESLQIEKAKTEKYRQVILKLLIEKNESSENKKLNSERSDATQQNQETGILQKIFRRLKL